MPEVKRGSAKAASDPALTNDPYPAQEPNRRASEAVPWRPQQQQSADRIPDRSPLEHSNSGLSRFSLSRKLSPRDSNNAVTSPLPRQSLSYAQRSPAPAYYDSRAAGHKEYMRRGKTLQEYYADRPELLPQLPFTWHHGKRRWRLWFFAFLVFVDASVVPVALYFGMKYSGHVQEYIIFAIVTSIWGGPTYLEFAIRCLRLMKKERFYRPLGTNSRWCADSLTWTSTLTITVVTTLFIVGSAPRDTWLRVVTMSAPSILWCYGGCCLLFQLYHYYGWRTPIRISSTAKGEKVLPGVYYFIEDVLAVNARCGRPFREALAARFEASPRFRRMLNIMSWFWSVGALVTALILTFVAVLPWVPENWAYGVCWLAPFIWAFVWGLITIWWCKKEMVKERLEWEAGEVPTKEVSSPVSSPIGSPVASPVTSPV